MKYYSEVTKKVYDTEEALKEAEVKEEEKLAKVKLEKEERATAAKEVEEAFKKANEAYKEARQKMDEFVKKYGSFHYSVTSSEVPATKSLFDYLFDSFWF